MTLCQDILIRVLKGLDTTGSRILLELLEARKAGKAYLHWAELSKTIQVDASTLSSHLDKLIKAGLVSKLKTDHYSYYLLSF